MTPPTLPEVIEMPIETAAAIRFDPLLTARDRSLQIVVGWWAGQRRPPEGEYSVMVPDSIRRTITDHRRIPRARRVAMWERFDNSVVSSDETMLDLMDGVPGPTTQPRHRAVKFDRSGPEGGKREWLVEREVVEAYLVHVGDEVVEVPTLVLERARCRYTLPLLLRVLAWGSGRHATSWRRWEKEDHYVLRIKLDEFRDELGTDPSKPAAEILRKELEPAIAELQLLTDFAVDIQAWHAPSLKKKYGGRVMGFNMIVPKIAPVTSSAGLPLPPEATPAEVIPLHDRPFGRHDPALDATDEDLPF
jgi:hypothetical protein